jgi:hypothetical protein
MYEFMCGELSGLRSRGTTAYTLGGDVHILYTSTTRTLHDRKRVSASQSNHRAKPIGPYELTEGSYVRPDNYWLPYSYGNPVVNLGANALLIAMQTLGMTPEPELPV